MSGYAECERQVTAALYLDAHREGDRLLGAEELKRIYNIDVPPPWLNGIIADLERQDIVTVYRDKDGASAVLKDSGFKLAHSVVIEALGNPTTFEVHWSKEEILTDAHVPDWFPLPIGWKWLQFEDDSPLVDVGPQYVHVENVIPIPPADPMPRPPKRPTDWQKWGVILGGLSIVVAIAIALLD